MLFSVNITIHGFKHSIQVCKLLDCCCDMQKYRAKKSRFDGGVQAESSTKQF